MTIDLLMLAYTALLTILLFLTYGAGVMLQTGLGPLAGNREEFRGDQPGWIGRAQRTHRNTLEALAPFAALVLVAHAGGEANATTGLAAQAFFYARLIYVPIYIIGIPWLRTVVWTVGWIAMLVIFYEIVT